MSYNAPEIFRVNDLAQIFQCMLVHSLSHSYRLTVHDDYSDPLGWNGG